MAEAKQKQGTSKRRSAGDLFDVQGKDFPKATKFPRLRKKYEETIAKKLQADLGIKNIMNTPRLKQIVVNACSKEAVANPKTLDHMVGELALITGQKPVLTRAHKSIAGFKLREGVPIGARVTLRGKQMYDFLDRLINLTLPAIRDFKGVSTKSFDGRGNYTLGIAEQMVFNEIDYDKIDKTRGLNISIVTTATNNKDARLLLTEMGFPFRK